MSSLTQTFCEKRAQVIGCTHAGELRGACTLSAAGAQSCCPRRSFHTFLTQYQVVVPYMEEPGCVHDCGFINLTNYEEKRKKFVQEYLGRKYGKER